MSLDDELQRIRENLKNIVDRLNCLEEALERRDRDRDLISIARGGRMGASLYVHSIDLYERFRRARTIMEDPRIQKDPISKAVIDSLAYLGTAGVSTVTRHVREVRGTASRTTVRERLRRLGEYGIVEQDGTRYSLRQPEGRNKTARK